MKKIIITGILFLLLIILVGAGFYFSKNYFAGNFSGCQTNKNILILEKLFIEKVLEAKGKISYEDRLELETAVANIDDIDIKNQWAVFLESKTGAEAQKNTLSLMKLFAQKISE